MGMLLGKNTAASCFIALGASKSSRTKQRRLTRISFLAIVSFLSLVGAGLAESDPCWPIVASRESYQDAIKYIEENLGNNYVIFSSENGSYAISERKSTFDEFNSNKESGYYAEEAFCSAGRSFKKVSPDLFSERFSPSENLPSEFKNAIYVFKVDINEEVFYENTASDSTKSLSGGNFPLRLVHGNLIVDNVSGDNFSGWIYPPPYYEVDPIQISGVNNGGDIEMQYGNNSTILRFKEFHYYDNRILATWDTKDFSVWQDYGHTVSEYSIWFKHGDCMEFNAPLMATPNETTIGNDDFEGVVHEIAASVGIEVSTYPRQDERGAYIHFDGQNRTPRTIFDLVKALRQDSRIHYADLDPVGDCGGADISIFFMKRHGFFKDEVAFEVEAWRKTIDETVQEVLESDHGDVKISHRQLSGTKGSIWGSYSFFVTAPSEVTRELPGFWDAFRLDFVAIQTTEEASDEISILFEVNDFATVSRGLDLSPSPPDEVHFVQNLATSKFGEYVSLEADILFSILPRLGQNLMARCYASNLDAPVETNCVR